MYIVSTDGVPFVVSLNGTTCIISTDENSDGDDKADEGSLAAANRAAVKEVADKKKEDGRKCV